MERVIDHLLELTVLHEVHFALRSAPQQLIPIDPEMLCVRAPRRDGLGEGLRRFEDAIDESPDFELHGTGGAKEQVVLWVEGYFAQ